MPYKLMLGGSVYYYCSEACVENGPDTMADVEYVPAKDVPAGAVCLLSCGRELAVMAANGEIE
jgi:hypothetical protein